MVKKQRIRRTVPTLSILPVPAIFLVSAGLLCRSLYEYRKGEKGYGELRQHTAKASGQESGSQSPGSLPARGWEPMLAVGSEALKKLNPHTIAWIHVPRMPVSYPVTRGKDNSYYLTRTFFGVYNGAGCILMGYRSSPFSGGGNMVLYEHNMKNGSMFDSLKHYWGNEYYRGRTSFHLYTAKGDNFLCYITDRRRIPVQTDFLFNMWGKEEETGESDKTNEGGEVDRDVGITLVTCVAGKNEERLAIEAGTK